MSLIKIINISTNLDHILHPLTPEKGTDKPSLVKRIAGIALFILVSTLTFGLASIYYIYKAKWKYEKTIQSKQPSPSPEPPFKLTKGSAENHLKLDFDQPAYLSCNQIIHTLKISTRDMLSELPEFSDSIFSVGRTPNDSGLYEVIRQKINALPSKRELTVSQIFPTNETLVKIANVAKNWMNIAIEKQNEADDWVLFSDSSIILNGIKYNLENPAETAKKWDKIYICEDIALKEIQAIALTYSSPDKLKISHIATHPKNIRCRINRKETTRVEGAASTLIKFLANTLPIGCKEIYLESVDSAKSFYKKLGFEELDRKLFPPEELGCFPMSLRV